MKDTNNVDVKQLLLQIQEKVYRGTVTARDWRELAASDPEVAHKELSGYLQSFETVSPINPFENTAKSPGVAIGFLVGLALTVVTWYFMPDLRAAYKDDIPGFADFATGSMFAATFFSIVGAYLGGRWGTSAKPAPRPELSFEEMLQRFEVVQRQLHAV